MKSIPQDHKDLSPPPYSRWAWGARLPTASDAASLKAKTIPLLLKIFNYVFTPCQPSRLWTVFPSGFCALRPWERKLHDRAQSGYTRLGPRPNPPPPRALQGPSCPPAPQAPGCRLFRQQNKTKHVSGSKRRKREHPKASLNVRVAPHDASSIRCAPSAVKCNFQSHFITLGKYPPHFVRIPERNNELKN